jgi:hypothetical protein
MVPATELSTVRVPVKPAELIHADVEMLSIVGKLSASAVLGGGPSPRPPTSVKTPIITMATSAVPTVLTSRRSERCGRML